METTIYNSNGVMSARSVRSLERNGMEKLGALGSVHGAPALRLSRRNSSSRPVYSFRQSCRGTYHP